MGGAGVNEWTDRDVTQLRPFPTVGGPADRFLNPAPKKSLHLLLLLRSSTSLLRWFSFSLLLLLLLLLLLWGRVAGACRYRNRLDSFLSMFFMDLSFFLPSCTEFFYRVFPVLPIGSASRPPLPSRTESADRVTEFYRVSIDSFFTAAFLPVNCSSLDCDRLLVHRRTGPVSIG